MSSNFIISNVISLVLRKSDIDAENDILIWRSVSDGQKTCSSKGIYTYYTLIDQKALSYFDNVFAESSIFHFEVEMELRIYLAGMGYPHNT